MPHDNSQNDPVTRLYRRPGLIIRRAHQIAVSVFLAETAEYGVTTTQYGVLILLSHRGGLDQATVARMLGLDRSTTALVVRKLESGGLVRRKVDDADRRRHCLTVTPEGAKMLEMLHAPAQKAVQHLLSPLEPEEQETLVTLLSKLNAAHNATARVPLLEADAATAV